METTERVQPDLETIAANALAMALLSRPGADIDSLALALSREDRATYQVSSVNTPLGRLRVIYMDDMPKGTCNIGVVNPAAWKPKPKPAQRKGGNRP